MSRAIFTLCAAFSALLLLVAAGAWVQSFMRPQTVAITVGPQRAHFVESVNGRLVLIRQGFDEPLPPAVTARLGEPRRYLLTRDGRPWLTSAKAPIYSDWRLGRRRFGFGAAEIADFPSHGGLPITHRQQEWMFPHWLPVLAGLPVPLLWLWNRRRSRRWRLEGRCLGCGYDLRESPQRCPECGREVTAAKGASA